MEVIYRRPIVGVYVNSRQIDLIQKQNPFERLQMLEEANGKVGATLYFFSILDVDFDKLNIMGTYFDRSCRLWKTREFPLPDIFYNRGGSPQNILFELLIFILKKRGIKFINYFKGFDKWKVHEILAKIPELKAHLPETWLCKNGGVLKNMLNRHQKIYLKACRGRKGQQVLKVEKMGEGRFRYSFYRDRLYTNIVSYSELKKIVTSFFEGKPFIVQEAINLPQVGDKSIIDFRAEVQRDGRGELKITAVSLRVGNSGSPITTHANAFPLDYYVKQVAKYGEKEEDDFKRKIEIFIKKIYLAMEKVYGNMGELGIDFAVDKKGQLWFIECNSQPTKISLMKAYDRHTVDLAFLNPLEYGKYLFSQKKNYRGSGR